MTSDAKKNIYDKRSRELLDLLNDVYPTIKVEKPQGKTVLRVVVDEQPFGRKPVYFKKEGLPKGAYRRIGSADLVATETLVRQSIEQYKRDGRDHLQVAFGCTGEQHRSVYFAERMAERLSGIDGVEIEITHTAKQYWTTSHDSENRDIIFQEELR